MAWADWLGAHPWEHWVTLTFKKPAGPKRAIQTFRTWIRRLEHAAQMPVFWFVGLEDGELLGRLHMHALVGNTRELAIADMSELWPYGFSHIERYDPARGAAHYITKYVVKDLLDYDISANLKRAISPRDKPPVLPGLGIPSTQGGKDV